MSHLSRWYPHAIAAAALILGCAVYFYARPASVFYGGFGLDGPLFGQLPTFLHTLAFGLAGAMIATRHRHAAILAWGLLEALAELAQHDAFPVPAALDAYRQSGTFDQLDLLAILIAVCLAVIVSDAARSR